MAYVELDVEFDKNGKITSMKIPTIQHMSLEDIIEHTGKKGMKWGQRKGVQTAKRLGSKIGSGAKKAGRTAVDANNKMVKSKAIYSTGVGGLLAAQGAGHLLGGAVRASKKAKSYIDSKRSNKK